MSQENMRVFEKAGEALGRGDMESFLALMDDDIVWIAARSAVEARTAATTAFGGSSQTTTRTSRYSSRTSVRCATSETGYWQLA